MRLTQFTDFGVRALILLAERDGEVLSASHIAESLGVSVHHMAKVLQALSGAGLVRGQRGKQGGVVLAQAPEAIRIGTVVRMLEEDQPLVECCRPDGGSCVLTPECRLRGMLLGAQRAFLAELDRFTLADCRIPGLASLLVPRHAA